MDICSYGSSTGRPWNRGKDVWILKEDLNLFDPAWTRTTTIGLGTTLRGINWDIRVGRIATWLLPILSGEESLELEIKDEDIGWEEWIEELEQNLNE